MSGGWIAAGIAVVFFPTFFAWLSSKADSACKTLESIDDGLFIEEPALGNYNFDED